MQNIALIIHNIGTLVTVAGHHQAARGRDLAEVGLESGKALAIAEGCIVAIGTDREILDMASATTRVVNAQGGVVLPGFVDPHTHLLYAGNRAHEYALKLEGVPYLDILRQGGGILSTVRHTRAASPEQIKQASCARMQTMLELGTTTAEVKTGYGLTAEHELLHLDLIAQLNAEHPLDLVATFMPAHAIPPEYADNREDYMALMLENMLPQVGNRARYIDVFCETGVFTPDEAREILKAGQTYGLQAQIHADEMAASGGSLLAAEVGAVSADHLLRVEEDGMAAMAEAGVVGVCLPATSFNLAEGHHAPARRMLEHNMALALATDSNPGSSPTENMQLVLTLACLHLRLTPAEALVAATVNAAHAIGAAQSVGSIEVGKQADLLIALVPNIAYFPYHFGVNHIDTVIKAGEIVAGSRTVLQR